MFDVVSSATKMLCIAVSAAFARMHASHSTLLHYFSRAKITFSCRQKKKYFDVSICFQIMEKLLASAIIRWHNGGARP